jgi:putative alpha-1,2-mannosidase
LYTIIAPGEVEDMLASFLGHYYETGLLPVWSFVGNETNMMIGYHSVPVIVDAFFKGIILNGKPYQQTNTTHETMMQGGELHFVLSNSFTDKK